MKKDTVIIDIDGVLADYRMGLLLWIVNSYPRLSSSARAHLVRSDTWIDHTTMNCSFREWLECLEHFRMSRGKVDIPIFLDAYELVSTLKEKGYFIVLLTSRPIDVYSNIYIDTVEWLRRNHIEYNSFLWCRNKAEMVFRNALIDRTRFAIDDEIKHIKHFSALGIQTYWVDHYKVNTTCIDRCLRVQCLGEILRDIKES